MHVHVSMIQELKIVETYNISSTNHEPKLGQELSTYICDIRQGSSELIVIFYTECMIGSLI
jgi:hypothetical protein